MVPPDLSKDPQAPDGLTYVCSGLVAGLGVQCGCEGGSGLRAFFLSLQHLWPDSDHGSDTG